MCLSHYEQWSEHPGAPVAALRRKNQQVVGKKKKKKNQDVRIVSGKRQPQVNTSVRNAEMLPSFLPSQRSFSTLLG